MKEQEVKRLDMSHEACVRRFQERAEQAFDAGDIDKALSYMKFVPQSADKPQTPPHGVGPF